MKEHQIPDDLHDKWKDLSMTVAQLAVHYGVSLPTIYRWKKKAQLPWRCEAIQDPQLHPEWVRGVTYHQFGYRMIYIPTHPHATASGYIREHRYVMEQHLGRYLTAEECVHHIDENKTNNQLSNLQLFANNGDHLRNTTHSKILNDVDLHDLYVTQRLSTHDIAKAYSISTIVVSRALRRANIPVRSLKESRANPAMPSKEVVLELWKTMSLPQIAKKFGVTRACLKTFCHYYKLKAPTLAAKNRRGGATYPDDIRLWDMHQTMKTKDMAIALGVPYYGLATHMSHRQIHRKGPRPVVADNQTLPE